MFWRSEDPFVKGKSQDLFLNCISLLDNRQIIHCWLLKWCYPHDVYPGMYLVEPTMITVLFYYTCLNASNLFHIHDKEAQARGSSGLSDGDKLWIHHISFVSTWKDIPKRYSKWAHFTGRFIISCYLFFGVTSLESKTHILLSWPFTPLFCVTLVGWWIYFILEGVMSTEKINFPYPKRIHPASVLR